MRRGIVAGIFCLLFALAISGCGGKAPPPAGVDDVVESYIAAASARNWNQAVGYLSGEAYAAKEQNNKQELVKPITVTDEKLNIVSKAENFALVDVDFTEMPGHNRKNYRFYLEKETGKWLIYKIEMTAPSLPAQLKDATINIQTVSGATSTSGNSINLVISSSGNNSPLVYSINGGLFTSLPSNGIVGAPVSSSGPNVIQVSVKDKDGNVTTKSITVWKLP